MYLVSMINWLLSGKKKRLNYHNDLGKWFGYDGDALKKTLTPNTLRTKEKLHPSLSLLNYCLGNHREQGSRIQVANKLHFFVF